MDCWAPCLAAHGCAPAWSHAAPAGTERRPPARDEGPHGPAEPAGRRELKEPQQGLPADAGPPSRLLVAGQEDPGAAGEGPGHPGLLSRRLLLWVWALVALGRRRSVQPGDIPKLDPLFRAGCVAPEAARLLSDSQGSEAGLAGERRSILSVMRRLCRWHLAAGFATSVAHGALTAGVKPLVLRAVIDGARAGELSLGHVALLTAVLVAEAMLNMWNKQLLCDDVGVLMMAAVPSLLSRRIPWVAEGTWSAGAPAEKLAGGRPASKAQAAGGQAAPVAEATLVGNDVVRNLDNLTNLTQWVSCVTQLLCGVAVLLWIAGPAALAGVGVLCFSVAVASYTSSINKKYDKRGLEAADERIALLSQVLDGVRFVKLSAWEEAYMERSLAIRVRETGQQAIWRTLQMFGATVGRCTPPVASMATFMVMLALGEPLEISSVFSTVSVFMTLRLPMGIIPAAMMMWNSLKISMQRVDEALGRPAVEPQPEPESPQAAASLRGVALAYGCAGGPVLSDVTLDVVLGRSLGVFGAVASGKSTLLVALLGGMQPLRGSVRRCGLPAAYVPQHPVVFSGSILANIVMGRAYDEQALLAALTAARFVRDLELLPFGIMTEIGERGTTLSGGQQARLNVARAFYHQPSVLVADDPLVAVDVHVAGEMFEAMQQWRRASGKRALVLATNQLHLLPSLDHLAYLEDGRVCAQGSYQALLAEARARPRLAELLAGARVAAADAAEAASPAGAGGLGPATPALCRGPAREVTGASLLSRKKTDTSLVQAEHRAQGAYAANVALEYARAVGPRWLAAYAASATAAYVLMGAMDWQLTFWVRGPVEVEGGLLYSVLALAHALFMTLTNVCSGFAGAHASRNLHSQCLQRILGAPVRWFDETPSGRTLSRMSADIAMVDLKMPLYLDHLCQMVFVILVNMVTICIIVPWMSIIILIVIPVFVKIDFVVNVASRDVKRITNNAMSPILTLLQEAASARLLLRVMGQEEWLHDELLGYVDQYNVAHYSSQSLMTFLRLVGNLVGVLVSFSTALLFWALGDTVGGGEGKAAVLALALTSSFVIPYFLAFASFFASLVRVFMASLERLLELKSELVPQEAPRRGDADPAPGAWPTAGRVEFRGATLRYMPHLPPAVSGLTMTVAGGERLGVVGRTGAGKSSLSVMLLRLVEMSSGDVLLDGVDISSVGLHTLRSAVAMVPQMPFLFRGTLRGNLDPNGKLGDEALKSALTQVGVQAALDADVGRGGEQFSAGERQLVAIARATLSHARVVVMDEPTASCDAQTDAHVQRVVLRAFAGRTLFCIAHRLNTVLGYDRILVMEAGEAAELGAPAELLGNPGSRFAQMVARMRETEA